MLWPTTKDTKGTKEKSVCSRIASGPACPVESYSTGVPNVVLVQLRASQRGRPPVLRSEQGRPRYKRHAPNALLPSASLRLCGRTAFLFCVPPFLDICPQYAGWRDGSLHTGRFHLSGEIHAFPRARSHVLAQGLPACEHSQAGASPPRTALVTNDTNTPNATNTAR